MWMKFVFLDTETTGNMPATDRLCAIAYKIDDHVRHELFKPPFPISVDAMATHHITNEMVADKSAFPGSQMHTELGELLAKNVLVAHNAPFDIGILANEGVPVSQYICTYRVARHLDAEGVIPRYGLQYLRYFLNLNVDGVRAHDAAGDIKVLEALFSRLQPKLSVEKMIEVSQQPVLFRTLNFGKYKGEKIEDVAKKDRGYLEWLLNQKQDPKATSKYGDEADWIYTLQYYLYR